MSGAEMTDHELRIVRFQCGKTSLDMSGPTSAKLLADRDYHHARAETAEDEAAQLLADLADMKRERDEARRELCDRAGKYASPGHGNPGHKVIARSIACASGWAYLYPEEPSR